MSAASDVRRTQTIEATIGSLVVRLAELRQRTEALEQKLNERIERLERVPPLIKTKTNATS